MLKTNDDYIIADLSIKHMQVLLAALWIIESCDAVHVYVMNWFVMYETPNSMSVGVISKLKCGWYKDS